MAIDPTLKGISDALEEYTKSGTLDKVANEAPPVGPDTTSGPHYMTRSERYEVTERLKTKSVGELMAIFNDQVSHTEVGVPLNQWIASSGNAEALSAAFNQPAMKKALDTAGASALQRQDLDPVLQA